MENNGGKPLIWTGLLLIAAAILLTGYNMWESERAEAENKVIVEQLEKVIPEPTPPETALIPEPAVPEEEIPDYILNPNMEMPTETVNGYEYIGVLEIPELELKLPVMSTWSYPRLRVAPCQYEGSVYSRNLILAAHNYNSHFGRLRQLHTGSQVTFTDVDGNIFSYEVISLETLMPTAVEEMESGDWDLTLFTCTVGGRTRVVVRCALV